MTHHESSNRPAFQPSVRMRAKTIIAAGHRLAILLVIDFAFARASVVNETSVVSSDLWTTADIFASLKIRPTSNCQQKDFAGYGAVEFGSRVSQATIYGVHSIYPSEDREDDASNLVAILKRVAPSHVL
jgi:hypothetical protein